MRLNRKRISLWAFIVLAVMFISLRTGSRAAATEAEGGRETVEINKSLSYTGLIEPLYTFDSSQLTLGGMVGAMVFNITIDLPIEGDVTWNDWCSEGLAVRTGDSVVYYDFGGTQVNWGLDFNGDGEADTAGVDSGSWVGSAVNGTCSIVVPINAEIFSIDFFDNCWDTATDISHYTINSATAVYGETAATEMINIGQEMTYTGTLKDSGYVFTSSQLTTRGNVSAVAFNVSILLPKEGDIIWNDWCGGAATVTVGDVVSYYDFGGAQVGWGIDITGDNEADTTGVGTASWIGSAENHSLTLLVPVNAEEFSITIYDNCWDTETDIPHLSINHAIALYGTITEGNEVTGPPTEEVQTMIPDFDPNGVYHAYLGVQSAGNIFRNAWSDASYGADGDYWEILGIENNFNALTGWDGPDIVSYPALFKDCEIKGNGTYSVSISDFDFGDDETFHLLFVSTDIPLADSNLTFSDVKVILNGSTKHTFASGYVPGIDTMDKADYYEIHCINIKSDDLGGMDGLFEYEMPDNTAAIEFRVSGFAYDNPDVSEPIWTPAITITPMATDTPALQTDDNDDSSDFSIWILIVIAVVALGGVVVILSKKANI